MLRASLALAAVLAGSLLAAPRALAAPFGASYPPEQVYNVALHVHGSMSEQFGSMEWQTDKAVTNGADVLWWTDHDWRLTNDNHMNKYTFEEATWNAKQFRWSEPCDVYGGQLRYWDQWIQPLLVTSVVDSTAAEGTQSLRMETLGDGNPQFSSWYLEQNTSALHNKYSLAKRLTIEFSLLPEDLDAADSRFVLETELSDHSDGTKILRYVIGTMEGEGVHSIPLPYTQGVWNDYSVDVTADAITHFSVGGADSVRGEDNGLGMARIKLETKAGAGAVVFFDDYRLIVDPTMVGNAMLDKAREITSYYQSLNPQVTQFVGTEVSKYRAQPHLNGYAPNVQLVDYAGTVYSDSLHYAVDQIHALDGAVSLNHVYGPLFEYQWPETQSQNATRHYWTKVLWARAKLIGVDVFEVGYRQRGGMDLDQHLNFWDAMNANAVFVTGNGVTDTHGRGQHNYDGWGPSEWGLWYTNNFTTWMYAEALTEADLVKTMKSGRCYFGDPYRYSGQVDLCTLDGFRMGQIVYTDRNQHDLVIDVTDVADDVQVRLLQLEIKEDPGFNYVDPVVIRDEYLVGDVSGPGFTDTVNVDTTLPSLVRVEVYDVDSKEMVFSNPIHFVRTVPMAGIAAERIGVRVGDARVFAASGFTLTSAALSNGVLTLQGDEETVGLGSISIDPEILGAPATVVGAAGWSFAAGILTLDGFSGTGSTIDVIWGGTAAGPGSGAPELALGSGRPNPFGAGTLIDYSVPRPGWTRLEVVDVTGRRVRVLALGFVEPGPQRVRWDGTNESGRPVADGVYWVRLEHDGKRLVQKTVKLR